MADNETTPPEVKDSSYLFSADAAAIYSTAPTLNDGLNELSTRLQNGNWDDPESANKYAADYAHKLSQRFPEEKDQLFSKDNVPQMAPVRMSDVKPSNEPRSHTSPGRLAADLLTETPIIGPLAGLFHESPEQRFAEGKKEPSEDDKKLNQIDAWERENLNQLAVTKDPAYATVKAPLSEAIKNYASDARRNISGKSQDFIEESYNRVAEGETENILKLFGAKDTIKNLYEHTDPTADGSIRGKLASAIGSIGGFVGSEATAGPLGFLLYGGGTAAGAVKSTYKDSLERTGDSGRATVAGFLEAGSQAVALVGGQVAGAALKGVGKVFGEEVATGLTDWISNAAKQGVKVGALNTVSGIISQGANRYGSGKTASESVPDSTEDMKGFAEDFLVNSVLGGALHLLPKPSEGAKVLSKPETDDENLAGIKVSTGSPPVKEEGGDIPASLGPKLGTTSFQTENGHHYAMTADGKAAARTNLDDGSYYHPMARTFFLDPETAAKVALLQQTQMPDGSQPHVATDGKDFFIRSQYLDDNLNPVTEPTGNSQVKVSTEGSPALGLYPVDVGVQQNGLITEVPSYFGGKITTLRELPVPGSMPGAGAAGPFPLAPSEATQRILANADVSPEVKAKLEQWGAEVHLVIPRGTHEAQASDFVQENGLGAAYDRIENRTEHENSEFLQALAAHTAEAYDVAGKDAASRGNTDEAGKYFDLSARMHEQWNEMRSATGRALGQVETINPEKSRRDFLVSVRENALNEAAKAEGVTRNDLAQSEKELQSVNAELEQIGIPAEEKAVAANEEQGKQLSEVETAIKTYESEAEKRHTDALTETEKAASQDEAEAKRLEEAHTKNFESENKNLHEALNAAEERIRELNDAADKRLKEHESARATDEKRISDLESKGTSKAEEGADERVRTAESTVEKLKENKAKGSKVKPESIAAAEENVKRRRAEKENISALDGMTPEEKKEYQKLLRQKGQPSPRTRDDVLKAGEKKEIQGLEERITRGKERAKALTPEISPAAKEKIDFLRGRARSKRAEEGAKNPLDRLTKREQNTLQKLKEKRASYPKAKGEAGKSKEDFLTPAEKAKVGELLQKKKSLEERAKRVQSTVQQSLAEAAPEAARYKELLEKSKASTGRYRDDLQRAAFTIRDKFEEKVPVKNSNFLRRWWIGNEISSPNTFLRKTIGELNQGISTIVGYLGKGRVSEGARFGTEFSKTAHEEIGNFLSDLRGAWQKEGYKGIEKLLGEADRLIPREERLGLDTKKGALSMTEGSKKKLSRNDFDNSALVTNSKVLKPFVRALNTIFGTFATGRAIYVKSLYEGFANAEAFRMSKEEGLRGENLRQAISNKLMDSEATYKGYLDKAHAEAKDLASNGITWSDRDIRIRAAEMMEHARDADVHGASLGAANYYDLNKTPEGWVGKAFQGLGKFVDGYLGFQVKGKEYNPISYLFRFLNIGANLLNNQLEFIPGIGHGKAFLAGEEVPDVVKSNIMGKANVGFALTAGLLGKLYMQKDDKNPFFDVHGAGPSDKAQAAMFRAEGHRPFSIELNTGNGKKIIPLPVVTGPLALMLGLVGSVNDSFKYDRIKSPPETGTDKFLALGTALASGLVRSVANEPFFKNWGMLIDAYDRGDAAAVVDSLAVQPAKGFVPLIGLERYINKFVSQPIDSYKNLGAKILADTPFAQLASGPRLNPMGEPIKEDWLGDHGPLAPFLIAQNSDKDFAWLSDNGYHIPMMKMHVKLRGLVGEDETDPKRSPGSIVDGVLTENERARVLQETAPEVRGIVSQFREKYGAAQYDKNVQRSLSMAIDGIRNRKKYDLFLK